MPVSFVDQIWEDGRENFGGGIGPLYYLPREAADISEVTSVDGVSLVGNITAPGAQKAIKVYATEDTIDYQDQLQGDPNGETTMNTLAFFHPGDTKKSAAFTRKIQVTPGIFFFKDSLSNWRVLGLTILEKEDMDGYIVTKEVEARVRTREATHGNRADSRKGTTFTINHIAPHKAAFYEGIIPFETPAE